MAVGPAPVHLVAELTLTECVRAAIELGDGAGPSRSGLAASCLGRPRHQRPDTDPLARFVRDRGGARGHAGKHLIQRRGASSLLRLGRLLVPQGRAIMTVAGMSPG